MTRAGRDAGIEATVIVPCHRAEATLERCLMALLAQQAPFPFEILVVENHSPDATLAIARRVASGSGGRLRVTREATPGAYAARNRGIREARGRHLLFTDADCEVQPGWVARLVEALADPSASAVGGDVVGDPRQQGLLARYARAARILSQDQTLAHPRGSFLQTANLAVRSVDACAIGGFDAALRSGGDADFCWRLKRHAPDGTLRRVAGARVQHTHRQSVTGLFQQFRRYGSGDVALARRNGVALGFEVGKLLADLARVLALPLLLLGGALRALRRGELLPVAYPVLRVVQLLGRRTGQLEALGRGAGAAPRLEFYAAEESAAAARRSDPSTAS